MSLFTNNLWSSFPCQLGSWSSWATLKQHPLEYLTSNFYYEKVPLFFPGQVIMRTGVEMMTTPKRTEGQFKLQSGQSNENQSMEQGFGCMWSLTIYHLLSQREKQQYVLVYCTFLATLLLIYRPARHYLSIIML